MNMNKGGNRGRNNNQQQRRRRPRPQGQGQGQQQHHKAPRGPAMTALGESTYEAVFDHGNEGYGIWFDGVVRDDPMYRRHWKGTGFKPLFVRIEEDRMVITRELDRELPPMEAPVKQEEERVFTPEEAAEIFGAEANPGGAEAADSGDSNADDSSDSGSAEEVAEEAPAAPVKRRRAPARRTVKKTEPAASSDDGDDD